MCCLRASKEALPMRILRRLRAVVLIPLFVGGLVAILLGIKNGWFSVQVGRVSLSLMGTILLGKLGVQQTFAYLNNRRWKTRLRGRLLDEIEKIREIDRSALEERFWMRYPDWIAYIWSLYPDIEVRWKEIMNNMVLTAAQQAGRPIPTIGFEIPIHGVRIEEIEDTVQSLLDQTVQTDRIILAVNGHQGELLEQQVAEYVASLHDERVTYFSLKEGHKRTAMKVGFDGLDDLDETGNVDADTEVHHDVVGIGKTVKLIDPRVHAITSNVEIKNPERDELSFQTWLRYLYANLVERAAQSWFYCVSCMSGPYMQCRTQDIRIITRTMQDRWEKQYFFRERVGPGDDRTLTECILSLGLGVVFICDMHTFTDCPATMSDWKKQQTRWARSGLRGVAVKVIEWWFWEKFAVLTIFDELYLATFSFLLMIVVGQITWRAKDVLLEDGLIAAGAYVIPYLILVIAINLVKAELMARINHDVRHRQAFWYIKYQLRYLVWIKVWALATITNSNWGTRGASQASVPWWRRFRRR